MAMELNFGASMHTNICCGLDARLFCGYLASSYGWNTYPSVPRSTDLSPSAMAAIDPQVRARHKTTRIADQKHGSTPVLLRLTQSPQHILFRPLSLPLRKFIEERLDHSRHNVTGRNGIYPDAIVAPFCGKISPELKDGGFGGVISGADESLLLYMYQHMSMLEQTV